MTQSLPTALGTPTQPTVDFGTCWSCITDITTPAIMVSGFRVVAEAVLRRWTTRRGSLVGCPNYGKDLTELVGDDLGPVELAREGTYAAAEAQKDERVLRCRCSLTTTNGVLKINAAILTAKGPFRFVAQVDAVSVQLLQVSG